MFLTIKIIYVIINIIIISNCLLAKNVFTVLPVISYTTENRFMIGAFVNNQFPLKKGYRFPNSIQSVGIYTTNEQKMLNTGIDLYFLKGKFNLNTQLSFFDWPQYYYGIGNNSSEKNNEEINNDNKNLNLTLKTQVIDNYYFGLIYDYGYLSFKNLPYNSRIITENITGYKGGKISGTGFLLEKNTLDNLVYPSEGVLTQFRTIIYDDILSSDYKYNMFHFQHKYFYSIDDKRIIALNFLSGYLQGDKTEIPYQKYFKLGQSLRAYEQSRYIDKGKIAFRSEFRYFPWESRRLKRIGFVTFFETGKVFNNISDLDLKHLKISTGFGIRYTLSKKNKLNARFDIGFGKDSTSVMFLVRESF